MSLVRHFVGEEKVVFHFACEYKYLDTLIQFGERHKKFSSVKMMNLNRWSVVNETAKILLICLLVTLVIEEDILVSGQCGRSCCRRRPFRPYPIYLPPPPIYPIQSGGKILVKNFNFGGMPMIPGIPSIPSIPQIPQFPQIPQIPQFPQIPMGGG